jgi:NTE family protein
VSTRRCSSPAWRAATAGEADRRIGLHLDEVEAAHDFVLLLADASPTPWTQRCSRRCDELLLLADADAAARSCTPDRARCLCTTRSGRAEAAETLVLLHPADRRSPRARAAGWTAGRQRPRAHPPGARPRHGPAGALQSRTAVGLVLAGGGARGLAHLGVYRALQEAGIEIDCVGGTSIGAVMATLVALDRPLDET